MSKHLIIVLTNVGMVHIALENTNSLQSWMALDCIFRYTDSVADSHSLAGRIQ